MPDNYHILIVEDEPVSRIKLVGYFEKEGYRVSAAANAKEMREITAMDKVDLILLDINLPDEDGLVLAREQRSKSDIGIIMITGRTDEIDRIIGLEIGADDYVTKPFSPRELLARVKNLLRRTSAAAKPVFQEKNRWSFDDWQFDTSKRQLFDPSGEPVKLTRAEFELLCVFIHHPGVVLNRDRLLSQVTHRSWDPNDRTIDVLIRRLRRKIENDPSNPQRILTAHGEGYIFTPTPE